ncbi:hypothetical protein Anas_05170, partial [Armadillidium nasatum]
VSQRIRQSQGQSLLFNNLGTSLIIQSWIEEELNGGGVISMCSCTEYQNSLDVIKFLNITSHNADGSGNLLEEGIPEVIPKKRLSMLLFYWFRFGLEDIQ